MKNINKDIIEKLRLSLRDKGLMITRALYHSDSSSLHRNILRDVGTTPFYLKINLGTRINVSNKLGWNNEVHNCINKIYQISVGLNSSPLKSMNSIRYHLRDGIKNNIRNSFDGDIGGEVGMAIWSGTGSVIEAQIWRNIKSNIALNFILTSKKN